MLAIHTFTTKPWSISECIENYARAGVEGISIWRETVAGLDLPSVRRHLDDSGLRAISLVRGGFFTGEKKEERELALARNFETIREAETLGVPMIVLVCGATVGQSPRENVDQIIEGIAKIAPTAADAGVKLAIEPLHPKYAGNRSAICSLAMANDICEQIDSPDVGIAVDVYHVWWELDLEKQIRRCAAQNNLLAYHICDFKPDFDHPLLDRGLMGEGCIPLRAIDHWIRSAGFHGPAEVEIFSRKWWCENQHDFLAKIVSTYQKIYYP